MRFSGIVLTALASTSLIGAAYAQRPTNYLDLESIDFDATPDAPNLIGRDTDDFQPGEIRWFKLTLDDPLDTTNGRFLDFYTTTDDTGGLYDTEIGLYDDTGAFLTADDDGGAGEFSLLTFGLNNPNRTYPDAQPGRLSPPGAFDGHHASELPAGTYWLAVGHYDVLFQSNWQVTSNSTETGSFRLRVGSGAAAPEPGTLTLLSLVIPSCLLALRRRRSEHGSQEK